MHKYKYFPNQETLEQYLEDFILNSLEDQLDAMETDDQRDYTDRDRQAMRDKIADIKYHLGA